jgi:protein SCO1/2
MKLSEWKNWFLVLLAMGGTVFLGYQVWAGRPSDRFLKPITAAPAFSLKDQNGRVFSSPDLKGKIWVADFIFARCAGECPMLSQKLLILQSDWKGNGGLKLMSFSVDPARDTVKALKEYAGNLGADESQWFFLTGKKADLDQVIQKGFKLTAQSDPKGAVGFEFVHTTRLILVDGNGMIRGLYDGQEEEDFKKLRQDIRYLMRSGKKS